MSEQAKQEWHIAAGPLAIGPTSGIWLNGEAFPSVTAVDFSAKPGERTRLTLELVPYHVEVVADPELHLIVGDRRFRVIEETAGDLDGGLFGERYT